MVKGPDYDIIKDFNILSKIFISRLIKFQNTYNTTNQSIVYIQPLLEKS